MKSSYGSTCASQEVVFLSNYSNSDDDDDDNNIALIATLIICTKSDKKKKSSQIQGDYNCKTSKYGKNFDLSFISVGDIFFFS